MTDSAQDRSLPPAQSGRFGGALLNSYMAGYFIGIYAAVSQLLSIDLAPGGHGYFLTALGIESRNWAMLLCLVLYLVATHPVGAAVTQYHQFTGRMFHEDRIGFARAGGQDIGNLSGFISVGLMLVIFAAAVPPVVPFWVRIPAIIIIATWLGNTMARSISRRAFATLFGTSLRIDE